MSTPTIFASHLGPFITRHLALKQALGRQYASERNVLAHLDRFLATFGTEISAETFARWCSTIAHLMPGVRRSRMRDPT